MSNDIVKQNSEMNDLYAQIKSILEKSRAAAYKAVNSAIVKAYWAIGQVIVENEQQGNMRAEYGKHVLSDLSAKLTKEFGKGFDEQIGRAHV